MADITLILDSTIVFLKTGKKSEHWALNQTIKICKEKNIPYNKLYDQYSDNTERSEKLKTISGDLYRSNSKGYLIVFSNNAQLESFKFYKYNPKNSLGTSIEFNDLSSSKLNEYTAFGLNNITTIVVEGPITRIATNYFYDTIYENNLKINLNSFLYPLLSPYYTKTDSTVISTAKVKFKLERKYFTSGFTLGEMFINDKHFCYTVEDMVRFSTEACRKFDPKIWVDENSSACEVKLAKFTAIPCGTYIVRNIGSGKFHCTYQGTTYKVAPKLLTVHGQEPPCFKYIAMHSGETAGWSEGCIIMSSKITNKENGKVINDGQTLMNKIYGMILNEHGIIKITQKVNGKDLTQEDIDRIGNGEVLGEIEVNI